MIEALRAEVARYEGVIANINSLIASLSDAKTELEKAKDLVNYFAIDGVCPDNGDIKNNCNNITSIVSSCNSLISDIQVKINDLERKIEEELERIRREQEAGLM